MTLEVPLRLPHATPLAGPHPPASLTALERATERARAPSPLRPSSSCAPARAGSSGWPPSGSSRARSCNQLLIAIHKPKATGVTGFRAWLKRLGTGTFLEAAEGTRTLDLLHGKQSSIARSTHVLPANEKVPDFGNRWGCVAFRRVLPGLCQPIVNRQIEARCAPRIGLSGDPAVVVLVGTEISPRAGDYGRYVARYACPPGRLASGYWYPDDGDVPAAGGETDRVRVEVGRLQRGGDRRAAVAADGDPQARRRCLGGLAPCGDRAVRERARFGAAGEPAEVDSVLAAPNRPCSPAAGRVLVFTAEEVSWSLSAFFVVASCHSALIVRSDGRPSASLFSRPMPAIGALAVRSIADPKVPWGSRRTSLRTLAAIGSAGDYDATRPGGERGHICPST